MLTVAGGIILAIVLIAVFIGLFFFDVEWISKEPNAGVPDDDVFWLPGADLSHVRFRLKASSPRSRRQRFSKLQVILFCQASYQRIPAKKQSMQSLAKDFRVEERPPSTHPALP